MKTYLYYIILFIGASCIISELVNDFEQMKLFKATLNPSTYFLKDELRDTISYSARGKNPATNFNIYYGKLVESKIEGRVTAYDSFITKIRLENGNIPVWFCNIKGVNELVFRKTNNLPNTPFKIT